jgi:hypothetical protein
MYQIGSSSPLTPYRFKKRQIAFGGKSLKTVAELQRAFPG